MTLKIYAPEEVPQISCCYDCHFPYGSTGWIEAIVPDDVWKIISPTGDKGGLLCINCISVRCAEAGLSNVPVKFSGTEPLVPVEAIPVAVRCAKCNDLLHLATPDLSGLLAYGWRYDEESFGWICSKHKRRIDFKSLVPFS